MIKDYKRRVATNISAVQYTIDNISEVDAFLKKYTEYKVQIDLNNKAGIYSIKDNSFISALNFKDYVLIEEFDENRYSEILPEEQFLRKYEEIPVEDTLDEQPQLF